MRQKIVFLKGIVRKIILDDSKSFYDCLSLNNIGLVIGTHSTALMESWIVGVPSLAIKSSYDYGSHLWEDDLIELCEDTSLNSYIDKYSGFSKNKLNSVKNKIWGKNYFFNENKAISILSANDYKN